MAQYFRVVSELDFQTKASTVEALGFSLPRAVLPPSNSKSTEVSTQPAYATQAR
jgi:hypothetical protein